MTPQEWMACVLFIEGRLKADTALSSEDKARLEKFIELSKMLTPFAMQLIEALKKATVPISPNGTKAPVPPNGTII